MSLDTNVGAQVELAAATFQNNLDLIRYAEVRPLPSLEDELQHNGKYFRVAPEKFEPGLYVDTGNLALQALMEETADLSFQLQRGKRIGREDSHNNVFFGRLRTEPQSLPDGHLQIAVKSKETNQLDGLLGELAAFQYLGKLTLPTFRPAGLLVGENHASLLTHFDGPVYTMDTVDWENLSAEERWDELMRPVDTMHMLHTKGLFHCDLFFRNVGFYETGDTVIVDPELMVSTKDDMDSLIDAGIILDDSEKRGLHRIKRLMAQDFSALTNSIEANILAHLPKRDKPRGGGAKLKLYRKHLYEPYKQLLSYSEEPEAKVLLRAFDEMMLDLKERARKDTI